MRWRSADTTCASRETSPTRGRSWLRIDPYITDALLPDGNAIDLVTGVRRTRPDVSVIVASGFMGDAGSSPALEDACVVCLRKPFGHAQLLDAMQRARASV